MARTTRRWVVFGSRTAFAVEVVEIVWRRAEEVTALVDNLPGRGDYPWAAGIPVLGPDELDARLRRHACVIPQTTPGHRYSTAQSARAAGLVDFPALVDPTAAVGRTVELADGAVVAAGAIVGGLARVDGFAVLNRGSSVGHHTVVEAFASVGPGAVVAGSVRIGTGAFVGAGATIAPGLALGANATVGAGAVVVRDVPDHAVAVGNPARVVRTADRGFGGVDVPGPSG